MKNNSILKIFILGYFCATLISCTKDREFESTLIQPPPSGTIGAGTLVINEFVATGSTLTNPDFPLLSGSDWLEIYNPGNDTVIMKSGKWVLSDSIARGQADESILLKDTIVPPKGFLLIQCDSQDTVITQFHTAFNLSKDGEAIGLFYINSNGSSTTIDSYTYGPQTSGTSEGRSPDGSTNWIKPLIPTPGASNP